MPTPPICGHPCEADTPRKPTPPATDRASCTAHGTFECLIDGHGLSRAEVLSRRGQQTPVSARFTRVIDRAGRADTVPDARSFSVRFHGSEETFDLDGCSLPVGLARDGPPLTWPGMPTAEEDPESRPLPVRERFWSAVADAPGRLHMALWAMSDRGLPRSLRWMDGYGLQTFRLNDSPQGWRWGRFQWRSTLGISSLSGAEGRQLACASPDHHHRDLHDAIARQEPPSWDLCVQIFDQHDGEGWPFDLRDPTTLVPEEVAPLMVIGRMTLDRSWPERAHLRHTARPASARMPGPARRWPPAQPPDPSPARATEGPYRQSQQFVQALDAIEREQLIDTLSHELGPLSRPSVRLQLLGHLRVIDEALSVELAQRLAIDERRVRPARAPLPPAAQAPYPSLSAARSRPGTLRGRHVGALVSAGADAAILRILAAQLNRAGARLSVIGMRPGCVSLSDGCHLIPDVTLGQAPAACFDAVAILGAPYSMAGLQGDPGALDWVRDAWRHGKPMALVCASVPLCVLIGAGCDEGMFVLDGQEDPRLAGLDLGGRLQIFCALVARGRWRGRRPAGRC